MIEKRFAHMRRPGERVPDPLYLMRFMIFCATGNFR